MKILLFLLFFICTTTFNGFAQQTSLNDTLLNVSVAPSSLPMIKTQEAANYIGSRVIVSDTVFSYLIDDDATITLNVGAEFPNQPLTVILKGKRYHYLNIKKIIGQKVSFRGTISLKNGKPQIIISKPGQILGFKKYQ